MREIKFRAWNTIKMIPLNPYAHDPEGMLSDLIEEENWVVMQYTGLKDKYGIEIYEGDILRIPADREWAETNFSAFEVFYHDNDATPTDCGLVLGRMKNYGNVAGGYCGYKLIPRDAGKMEVIGNIYEHPHLLEESK